MSGEIHGEQKQSRVSLDSALLDPALLQDEIALENALGVLDGHLKNSAANKESLILDLMSQQNLFEFAFSALSDEAASATKQYIARVFPEKVPAFWNSLSSSLLERLSRYFWYHNISIANFADQYRWVQMAKSALESTTTQQTKSSSTAPVEAEYEGTNATQGTSQRARKNMRRGTNAVPQVDVKLFAKLDLNPPGSAEDVSSIQGKLLYDLKDILMDYLDTLRKPTLASTFKAAYVTLSAVPLPRSGVRAANISGESSDAAGTVVAQPAEYGNILPLEAALNFDSVEGFGDWHILISTRANKDLRSARRRDPKRFIIYVKKIKELSNGHFSDDNHKKLSGNESDIPVYEAKMTGDSRLVYMIDCIREYGEETERQVIKLFGIYTHAQLDRDKQSWKNVSKQLSGKGSEYRKRILYRMNTAARGDKVYAPATFPLNTEQEDPSSVDDLRYLGAEEQQDLHERLVLEKFSAFSKAFLNNILADEDAAHIFHMSPTEQDIVRHVGSCYVYGRSGTGKTTTMVFKILGIERAHETIRDEYDADALPPRQLFVTYSRVLAEKVQEFYLKLATEKAAAGRTTRESSKLANEKYAQDSRGLVDKDEEELYDGTLPPSFSKLTDDHFPLFITFDQLCRLLEADQKHARSRAVVTRNLQDDTDLAEETNDTTEYALQRRRTFVSYSKFYNEYWPHLPQNLTKNLDPALVFAEIMGVIKGSEESISTKKGFLERDTYIDLSHRSRATFATRREEMYSLFQAYNKRRQERREWDAADRTHSIIRGLREFGVPGRKVDYLYIDEAQDNLLIDALILRSTCKNSSGLFWAGDTAQTISASSSFRFEELKSFLFRVEHPSTSIPEEFKLTVNYRSHGGIVRVAHSIVHLISTFWPHAIDVLADEKGIVNGAKPVFFTGWEEDRRRYEQFFFGAPESHIEFGAKQCILVRDDAARDRLKKQVGNVGTVLTLYESKGLEFDDVLLYNFFQDSTVDVSQWRVILNVLPVEEDIRCPAFDESRHNGVCRELKFLYVAITRARQNLWIADSSEKREPLRLFWTKQDLVTNVAASEDIPRLAKESDNSEWVETGRILFDNKQYLQASQAFAKARASNEKDIATAYYLREVAHQTPQGRNSASDPRRQAFLEAAQAFSLCASVEPLAKARLSYYRNSAESYREASEIKKAGEMYLLAEEHTEAAKVFRTGGLFDDAVDTIDKYAEKIEAADAERIRDVAKIHYSLEQNLDRATSLFSDVDQALEFMDDFGFNVARVELLERYGRLREAAEIHLAEGRTIEAIRLLLRDKANADSQSLLERILLKSVWKHLSFGMPLRIEEVGAGPQLQDLLPLADEAVTSGALSSQAVDELSLCRALFHNDNNVLHTLADKFISKHGDLASAVLCLDYVFQSWTHIENATVNVVSTSLERFSLYTRELQQMPSQRNLAGSEKLQRLFGFHPDPDAEDLVVIPVATLLHQLITTARQGDSRYRIRVVSIREDAYVLTSWELPVVLRAALREHLQQRIRDENLACSGTTALRLCPVFMVMGERDSHRRDRCNSSHDQEDMTSIALNSRVRMLWKQILIYQWATVFERRGEFAKQRRRWISRLYEMYFPVHYKAGSAFDVDFATIVEAEKGMQIVTEWTHDLLLSQDFDRIHARGFLTFIAEVVTLSLRFEKSEAIQYFQRAPCVTGDRPEAYIREGGRYIVWDLLDFLSRTSKASLSFGVIFVKNVCQRQLPIDANVMCHIVELLCAAYAIGHRLRASGSLHDITLSRRLLSRLHADDTLRAQDPHMLWQLVGTMSSLLREMNNRFSEFLLYNNSPRTDQAVRHIFVMRICKSFTLLGYNINDPQLHTMILRQIASFKNLDTRPDVRYPNIYQRYINASSWDDLKRAVRGSGMIDKNTPEELIHLRNASKVYGILYEVYGTRSVVYKATSDIPTLLRNATNPTPSVAPTRQAPEPTHAPSAPGDAHINVGYFQPLLEQEDTEEAVTESVDTHPDGVGVDNDIASEDRDADLVQHVATAPTADEIRAANVFATLYREKIARKRSAIETGAVTEYDVLYRSYQESRFVARMPRRYKLIFLGPLPLAFLTLRSMAVHVADAKSQAKARLTEVSHSKYEKVAARIKEVNSIARRIQQLRSLLEPKSELHLVCSQAQLRAHVQEIADIAAKYPGTIHGREWELETAVKGIVQGPKKPTNIKGEKPDLVDDIDGHEAY